MPSLPLFRLITLSLLLSCWCLAGGELLAETWGQFRGPGGQGHATTTGVPYEWSESHNVVWKTPIPGRGHSSPVIEDGEIWMTTAIESPLSAEEKQRRLADNTGGQPLSVSGSLSMRAVCVQASSGKRLHDIELMTEEEPDPIHALNSFASPTPILENGRLYCHFGANGTACLDTRTGKVLWTNQSLKLRHENGPGSSPVLHGDLLIFHCDGSDVQYIAALDKHTGQVAWRTDRSGKMHAHPQMKKAYGTPLIVPDRRTGQPLLMSPAADWLYCYDPLTGKELWKLPYGVLGFSIVPRPVARDGMLYMCTSFMSSELLAIRYDGQGDDPKPHIAWRFKKQAPQKPSPLLVEENLYLISDKGVATCLDAETGDVHWTMRLPGNYSASPLYADGRIYFSSQEGLTTVIQPSRDFRRIAANQLEGGHFASAAAVDGALFLRTDKALYRIQNAR